MSYWQYDVSTATSVNTPAVDGHTILTLVLLLIPVVEHSSPYSSIQAV